MSLSESARRPTVAVDPGDDLRVDCYVRSNVPGPIFERIEVVVERLQRLHERDQIADYRISHWPAGRHADARATARDGPTRDDLVTAFERWADRHDHSIEPAFRREQIPSSPLGLGDGDPRERVRVPVVALALYEDDEAGTETDPTEDVEAIRGVVPYTERPNTDEERTYTVGEWLSTVETRVNGLSARTSRRDRLASLEQQR